MFFSPDFLAGKPIFFVLPSFFYKYFTRVVCLEEREEFVFEVSVRGVWDVEGLSGAGGESAEGVVLVRSRTLDLEEENILIRHFLIVCFFLSLFKSQ